MLRSRLLAVLLLLALAPPLAAQRRVERVPDATQDRTAADVRAGPRTLRVAKWVSLGGSMAAIAYGLVQQQRGDESYERLERLCVADAVRCGERLPSGAYADPGLERLYQDVLERHTRTRAGIIAGQVGIVASVVLFMLDLRDDGRADVIFDPERPRASVGVAEGGGVRLELRLPAGPGSGRRGLSQHTRTSYVFTSSVPLGSGGNATHPGDGSGGPDRIGAGPRAS